MGYIEPKEVDEFEDETARAIALLALVLDDRLRMIADRLGR